MTKLSYRKGEGAQSIKREVVAAHRGRPLIVEIQPEVLVFRLKGKRMRYRLGIVTAFEWAVWMEADILKRKRKQERVERRKMRSAGL